MRRFLSFILVFTILIHQEVWYRKAWGQAPFRLIHAITLDHQHQYVHHTQPKELKVFRDTSPLAPHAYVFVCRHFTSPLGAETLLSSYYPSGFVRQLLTCLNGKADGSYEEWYENGQRRLWVQVVGGEPHLHRKDSWSMHGPLYLWDEEGSLLLKSFYDEGVLHGSLIQHYNERSTSSENAESLPIKLISHYKRGMLHGTTTRFWPNGNLQSEETWESGFLVEGCYWDAAGNYCEGVRSQGGTQILFLRSGRIAKIPFSRGVAQGQARVFAPDGALKRTFELQGGKKHGEEVCYSEGQQPLWSLLWKKGKPEGVLRVWHINGSLYSKQSLCSGKRHGPSHLWYESGELMCEEEFVQGVLVKGAYFEKGRRAPFSTIMNGNGLVTFFNEEGLMEQQTLYLEGKPKKMLP